MGKFVSLQSRLVVEMLVKGGSARNAAEEGDQEEGIRSQNLANGKKLKTTINITQ